MGRTLAAGLLVALAVSGCGGDTAGSREAPHLPSSMTTPTESTTRPPPSTTAASTTTTTAATTTTSPPRDPITIAVGGDTAFTHGLDQRDPLGDIAASLTAADLAILNVETAIAEEGVGAPIEKVYTFKSPPVSARILADAGVDVAAMANNHALDFGPDAVRRTGELLAEAGVAAVGIGSGPAEAYAAHRRDVGGWDVAVLSFSRVPCDSPEPGEEWIPEIAWACPRHQPDTVEAVRSATDADLVVVMAHWGVERQVCPADHQRTLAREWIAAGADIVVGSHPHVLQGVEQLDGKWVLYSTGNFAFPSAREASSYTGLFTFTVSETAIDLAVEPVRIVEGRPVPALESRPVILSDLTTRSFGWAFDDDGTAVATDSPPGC